MNGRHHFPNDTANMSLQEPATASAIWVGRILSGLVIVFLLFDAAIKLIPIIPVITTLQSLGFISTHGLARGLGVLLLLCTILYAIPRTSLLGALLLTGYLGGAIAVQLRVGHPLFSHILFGGYLGIALWTGLLMTNGQVRSMILGRSLRLQP